MNFGRKRVLWTPQSTQKPYIDLPTQYGLNFQKIKKIEFLISKIMIKKFPKSIFPADEFRPPNRYRGSIHPIGAPNTPLSCCIGRTPSYRNLALIIPKSLQKPPTHACHPLRRPGPWHGNPMKLRIHDGLPPRLHATPWWTAMHDAAGTHRKSFGRGDDHHWSVGQFVC